MKSCLPSALPTLVDRLGDALTGERHVADAHPDRVGDRVADNTGDRSLGARAFLRFEGASTMPTMRTFSSWVSVNRRIG